MSNDSGTLICIACHSHTRRNEFTLKGKLSILVFITANLLKKTSNFQATFKYYTGNLWTDYYPIGPLSNG